MMVMMVMMVMVMMMMMTTTTTTRRWWCLFLFCRCCCCWWWCCCCCCWWSLSLYLYMDCGWFCICVWHQSCEAEWERWKKYKENCDGWDTAVRCVMAVMSCKCISLNATNVHVSSEDTGMKQQNEETPGPGYCFARRVNSTTWSPARIRCLRIPEANIYMDAFRNKTFVWLVYLLFGFTAAKNNCRATIQMRDSR